jgi:hypothetical protein
VCSVIHINVELVSNISKTVFMSIVRDWYDECCVPTLYLYTKLSFVSAQTTWGTVDWVTWSVMSCPICRPHGRWWVESHGHWSAMRLPLDYLALSCSPCGLRGHLLYINIACKLSTRHISPCWLRQRQSVKHRTPASHWHGWLPKETFYTVTVKASVL